MEIKENMTLQMKNVLSYRGKMSQQDMMKKSQEIEQVMKEMGVVKAGPSATTTFSVEQGSSGPIMDIEILIPIDKEIKAPVEYTFKPEIRLVNALMITHIGNPAGLENTLNELNAYIQKHKLPPITTGYNVTTKEPKAREELDTMEIDIYVGISPNIL